MSHFGTATCPRCHTTSVVQIDTVMYEMVDTHMTKKSTTQLDAEHFDREYFCDRCQKYYYATLVRKTQAGVR